MRLDRAAIGPDGLTVDPAAFRPSQESDGVGDVIGTAEAAERDHPRDDGDEFLRLAATVSGALAPRALLAIEEFATALAQAVGCGGILLFKLVDARREGRG